MNYAVLLLAGSSTRFLNNIPKQFYKVNDKPIYYYSLKALNDSKDIDGILLITLKDKVMDVYNETKSFKFNKVKAVIAGGNSRNESVRFALTKLKEVLQDDDIVLIHDAARPLLDTKLINYAITETKSKDATTFALRSYDTLVKATNYTITSYLNRNEIFRVQTPQTFKFSLILEAYKSNKFTNDDTELVTNLNKKVYLLKGDPKLFKITSIEDIDKLKSYLC